jgi:hypothetical protein
MGWMTRIQFLAGAGKGFFSPCHHTQTNSEAHTASYPMGIGGWALSCREKWLGCENDHSPPSSAKVKNAWSCTSTHPYIFMAQCLIKRINLHDMALF